MPAPPPFAPDPHGTVTVTINRYALALARDLLLADARQHEAEALKYVGDDRKTRDKRLASREMADMARTAHEQFVMALRAARSR